MTQGGPSTTAPPPSTKETEAATSKGKGGKAPIEEEPELSPEDAKLKEDLEMLVTRISEKDEGLVKQALESLVSLIKSSTSSMTSVPKPLKFLGPHYATIVSTYNATAPGPNKTFLADILSVLAMSYGAEGARECLAYRLKGTSNTAGTWGHEYIRHLCAELIGEYNHLLEKGEDAALILAMAKEVVPYCLKHNAEADACDVAIELEALPMLVELVDKEAHARVCLYIISCVPYVTPPDDAEILKTAHAIYRKFEKFPQALLIAMRLQDQALIEADVSACNNPNIKKQLAYMLARVNMSFATEDQAFLDILSNSKLSSYYLSLAKDLEVLEPKLPEDIYKSHLDNGSRNPIFGAGAIVDSARQNLASTFVNAFVNCGFGKDKLMLSGESQDAAWIYKNKDHGMMSATASLGLLLLWDVEGGLTAIDKYLYSADDYIKAGGLLAIGILNCSVRNESDPALALLSEHLESTTSILKTAAITGLGMAYAGTAKEECKDLLLPILADSGTSVELSGLSCLALGTIFTGTCDGDVNSTVIQNLMERDESAFKDPFVKCMGLGVGLLFIGQQEAAEATVETLKVIESPIAKQIEILVECCAYAGTGNVLKIQKMLHHCNDHLDTETVDPAYQSFAVLGIALIAMGEEIGTEMALRMFNHLMHYGEPVVKKTVPLAMALLCASHPLVHVLDLLSKYSHDHDMETALSAIFAMGIVGAGTNNARLAQMLRQLAVYYSKDPNVLFVVRLSQGLVHMGKGTLSLSPLTFDRSLIVKPAVAGILTLLVLMTDAKSFILNKNHYLIYYLVTSMYPRMLITLDAETLELQSTTVRVGQAVHTVGQAGRPKTITGFQTHSTPVLLGFSERAELASEEFLSCAAILEGVVVLEKNKDWEGLASPK